MPLFEQLLVSVMWTHCFQWLVTHSIDFGNGRQFFAHDESSVKTFNYSCDYMISFTRSKFQYCWVALI